MNATNAADVLECKFEFNLGVRFVDQWLQFALLKHIKTNYCLVWMLRNYNSNETFYHVIKTVSFATTQCTNYLCKQSFFLLPSGAGNDLVIGMHW